MEVVAGLGLESVDPTLGPVLAAFWQAQLRGEYPNLELQAPYIMPKEMFDTGQHSPSLQFEVGPPIPFPRMWASSIDSQELVQLHPRYFALNWRRVASGSQYDNWRTRRAKFAKMLSKLLAYLVEQDVEKPNIGQCEVTYINHLRPGRVWTLHEQWAKAIRVGVESVPYSPERIAFEAQFLVGGDAIGKGRLHCKLTPGFDMAADAPLYVLELTVRGGPESPTPEAALEFMDHAREAIDRTFLAITTSEVQEEWGKRAE